MTALRLLGLVLLASLAQAGQAPTKPVYRELGGYLLGQPSAPLKTALGEPTATEEDEDGEYLTYRLTPTTTLTVSTNDDDDATIDYLILKGSSPGPIPGFEGLAFGQAKAEAITKFGEPSEVAELDEGREYADFTDRNVRLIFSKAGTLEGVNILETEGTWTEPTGDARKMPSLEPLRAALASGDAGALLEELAADVTVYMADDTSVMYDGPARATLANPASAIHKALLVGDASLKAKLTTALATTEVKEIKYDEEGNTAPIARITGVAGLKDISFRWDLGRWRVWTIDMTP